MTAAVAPVEQRPWLVWLVALYIVVLLSLPVDVGVTVGGAVVTPSRLVLLAALAVALLDWRRLQATLRRVPRLVWAGWAGFLGAALVTAVTVPSMESWARYASLVGEGLVVFVLVCFAASERGGLRTLGIVFALTMIVVAATVLVLATLGIHYDYVLSGLAGTLPAPGITPRYGLEREAGPFRGAVYFGIWLTAASALILPAVADGAARLRRLALAGWLLLLVSVVLLTGSRMAMTTMFILPGIYFLVRGQRLIGIASLIAAVGVAMGVSLVPGNAFVENSTSLRIAAVGAAAQVIQANLLFGWGLLNDMSVVGGITGSRNYVDDTYLSIAVEVGLVGLGTFLLLAASLLRATLRGWRLPWALPLAIALLAVLGMGVLASVLQATQGYAAFFVLAALAVVAGSGVASSEPAVEIQQRP